MNLLAFNAIAALLQARSGLVIGPDKMYLVENRLGPLMRREGMADLNALAQRLRVSETLVREVVEAMTTNESLFFRDGKPFQHFQNVALRRLHAARPPGAKLRIWSAAASTGQEAYSLAMILADSAALLGDRRVEIVGTDLAREPLARARAGIYSQFEVQRGLPVQMLLRHFRREADGAWRIADALRAMVQFQEWNLLDDPRPLGRFDAVFLRNVLIYFDTPTKAQVLRLVAQQMAPDGVLYLGGTETVLGVSDCFVADPAERGVYTPAPAQAVREPAPALVWS